MLKTSFDPISAFKQASEAKSAPELIVIACEVKVRFPDGI